jgi:MFS family permease
MSALTAETSSATLPRVVRPAATNTAGQIRWYTGITRYQWLVLLLASLGWIFDIYEAQVFVASMNEAMPELLPAGTPPGEIAFYNNLTFGAFLLGGALGGVAFGVLSDRLGRKRTMTYTILTYSAFTCLSALAQTWWQMAFFRFLVAMGVGGEWAVASALVAEVFPDRARAWSQSIFHASSVLGTFLAAAAGMFIVGNPHAELAMSLGPVDCAVQGWRLAFVLGLVPALLIIWIRAGLREPDRWVRAQDNGPVGSSGSLAALLRGPLLRRTLVGVGLGAVGLATFWGAHIYGKDCLRKAYEQRCLAEPPAGAPAGQPEDLLEAHAADVKWWEMLGMFLVAAGGLVGKVGFGPLCERLGRRGAFLFFQLGGLAVSVLLFQVVRGVPAVCLVLPVFGFLTLGMHAGFSVYFPELFPTRLRSTGAGFCFNVGRILAAPVLLLSGWLQKDWGLPLENAATLLSLLFLPGALLLLLAPETKGRRLPA